MSRNIGRTGVRLECCTVLLTVWLQPLLVVAQSATPADSSHDPVLVAPRIPEEIQGPIRDINARLSRDLKPADNAAVSLVQLFGEDAFAPSLKDASLAMLGIEQIAVDGPRMVYIEAFLRGEDGESPAGRDEPPLGHQLSVGSEELWNADKFSLLTEYLQQNEAALNLLVTAASKPRLYIPMLSEEEPPRLLSPDLSIERRLSYLARCLAARGIQRWQTGQERAALDDLFACQRLAILLSQGSPFDVSLAKAQTIRSIGDRALFALSASGQLTSSQAQECLRRFEQLPPFAAAATAADVGERAVLYQELKLLEEDDPSASEFFEGLPEEESRKLREEALPKIKWNLVKERADEIQNGFVAALRNPDRQAQQAEFLKLDEQFIAWNETVDEQTHQFGQKIESDPDAASRWVGECMAMSLRPWYRQRRMMEDQGRSRHDMAALGLALSAYRHDLGEYPTSLSALAPRYLKSIPLDAHADEPFTYRRNAKDQASLISWGANRQDDAGSRYNDDILLNLN